MQELLGHASIVLTADTYTSVLLALHFKTMSFWQDRALRARGIADPPSRPPSVFTELGPDLLRTVSGRETGELPRLTRTPGGEVTELHWATYPYIGAPLTADGQ